MSSNVIMTKVLVTGASGMLGRAVFALMKRSFDSVEGWANSRLAGGKFKKVNLTNKEETKLNLEAFNPDVVVHCAAERRPDKVSSNPEESENLNVSAAAYLAELTGNLSDKSLFIYLSTDYVFDGKNPPYTESAVPNPINEYGRQKLNGEKACIASLRPSQLTILRVPILYGPVEYLGEGAIDTVFRTVLNRNVSCIVDDYQKRYPTHVDDVARVVKFLMQKHSNNPGSISGVYHWSGTELFTKYGMAKAMAEVFSLPMDHLTPDASAPDPSAAVMRPTDVKLSSDKLIMFGASDNQCTFREAVSQAYQEFL